MTVMSDEMLITGIHSLHGAIDFSREDESHVSTTASGMLVAEMRSLAHLMERRWYEHDIQ